MSTTIYTNYSKSAVKAIVGGTDEEWKLFEAEANYEYNTHSETYTPGTNWRALDDKQKNASVARVQQRCREQGMVGLTDAAEWKLYQLHKSFLATNKHKSKIVPQGRANTSTVASSAAPQGLGGKYDPVKDAAKEAGK